MWGRCRLYCDCVGVLWVNIRDQPVGCGGSHVVGKARVVVEEHHVRRKDSRHSQSGRSVGRDGRMGSLQRQCSDDRLWLFSY